MSSNCNIIHLIGKAEHFYCIQEGFTGDKSSQKTCETFLGSVHRESPHSYIYTECLNICTLFRGDLQPKQLVIGKKIQNTLFHKLPYCEQSQL